MKVSFKPFLYKRNTESSETNLFPGSGLECEVPAAVSLLGVEGLHIGSVIALT